MSARILVVDDDADMGREVKRLVERRGYAAHVCTTADDAFECFLNEAFDVVVTDLRMRGMSGVDLCGRIVENKRDVPVIVITGFGNLEAAVASLRVGAFDFLTKPFHQEQLMLAVERAARHRHLLSEVRRLEQVVAREADFGEIVGESLAIRRMVDVIARAAASEATVLVTGESGSGKELVARALHAQGGREKGPLVAINCAAMPETLLESELFGHTKGAFTDAKNPRKGLFLEANGGTLFLDEVSEMPTGMQAKLLRALETKRVRAVGATHEESFDARIVAATNRDLESLIQENRFREDLYYRLNVVHIEVPPLRSRGGDALILARVFLERLAKRHGKSFRGFSTGVAERLLQYPWPGNVRELMNAVERAVALARFDELGMEDLPSKVREYRSSHVLVAATDPSELVTLEEVERRYIARVMEAVHGNKTEATRVLGIDRSTLYRKLDRYGLSEVTAKP